MTSRDRASRRARDDRQSMTTSELRRASNGRRMARRNDRGHAANLTPDQNDISRGVTVSPRQSHAPHRDGVARRGGGATTGISWERVHLASSGPGSTSRYMPAPRVTAGRTSARKLRNQLRSGRGWRHRERLDAEDTTMSHVEETRERRPRATSREDAVAKYWHEASGDLLCVGSVSRAAAKSVRAHLGREDGSTRRDARSPRIVKHERRPRSNSVIEGTRSYVGARRNRQPRVSTGVRPLDRAYGRNGRHARTATGAGEASFVSAFSSTGGPPSP